MNSNKFEILKRILTRLEHIDIQKGLFVLYIIFGEKNGQYVSILISLSFSVEKSALCKVYQA